MSQVGKWRLRAVKKQTQGPSALFYGGEGVGGQRPCHLACTPSQGMSSRLSWVPAQGAPHCRTHVPASHLYVGRLQEEAGVFLQDVQHWQGQHTAEADGQKP